MGACPTWRSAPRPSPAVACSPTAAIPAGTEVLRPEAPVHEQGPVNHACDPNLGWAGDALVTLRDVAAGEELLVDYAMSTTDPAYLLRCHCDSYRCRQMVEGTDWRIPQLQLRYAGHWAPDVQRSSTRLSPEHKQSGLTVCCRVGHADRVTTRQRRRACPRRSAPGRCGRGCSRRPSSCWSSAASPARRPRWSRERAGVSRGAQLHHFPTKNDLVVAAVEHLTEVRGAELAAAAEHAADRADGAPARCCRCSATTSPRRSSPPRSSCGSRPAPTSAARRGRAAGAAGRPRDAPADRRAARRRRVAARRPRAGAGHPRPGPRPRPGQHDHRRRPPPRAGSSTSGPRTLDDAARRRRMSDLLDGLLDDLDRRGRPAPRRPSTGLGDDGWTHARPRPPGWTVATQVAHLLWTDEVAVLAAHSHATPRQGGLGRRRAGGDRRPDGFVDAGALEVAAAAAATSCSPAGPPAAPRSAPRCASCPDGPEDAVVRPADVAGVDGDRAVHGDLGARARRVRRRSAIEPEPTDRIRHVAHLGVRTRNFAFSVHELDAAGRGVPGRADRARPARPGPGAPRTPPRRVTGSAYDFCLLVTQRVHRDDTDLVAVGADAEHWLDDRPGVRRPARRGREATR